MNYFNIIFYYFSAHHCLQDSYIFLQLNNKLGSSGLSREKCFRDKRL